MKSWEFTPRSLQRQEGIDLRIDAKDEDIWIFRIEDGRLHVQHAFGAVDFPLILLRQIGLDLPMKKPRIPPYPLDTHS